MVGFGPYALGPLVDNIAKYLGPADRPMFLAQYMVGPCQLVPTDR